MCPGTAGSTGRACVRQREAVASSTPLPDLRLHIEPDPAHRWMRQLLLRLFREPR